MVLLDVYEAMLNVSLQKVHASNLLALRMLFLIWLKMNKDMRQDQGTYIAAKNGKISRGLSP